MKINKKVMLINLPKQEAEIKTMTELDKYIGGVGIALKLYETFQNKDPLIFAIGPLNGFFPYASKTCVVLNDSGVIEDLYIGGSLSTRMRFASLDAVVLLGSSRSGVVLDINSTGATFNDSGTDVNTLGLPGRRSVIKLYNDKDLLDDYFTTPDDFLVQKLREKNVLGMVVTGSEVFLPEDLDKYSDVYMNILELKDEMNITQGTNPSCLNCPMGCIKSQEGELGGNVLVHSLVACQFAETIYSDIGIVFSCLNVIGYDYKHEDLEALPNLVERTIKNLI